MPFLGVSERSKSARREPFLKQGLSSWSEPIPSHSVTRGVAFSYRGGREGRVTITGGGGGGGVTDLVLLDGPGFLWSGCGSKLVGRFKLETESGH